MLVEQLIEKLKQFDSDAVVICEDGNGGWDNIECIEDRGSTISIVFGGGSPFSDGG